MKLEERTFGTPCRGVGRRSTKVFVHARENLLTENLKEMVTIDKNSNNDNGMKYLLVTLTVYC